MFMQIRAENDNRGSNGNVVIYITAFNNPARVRVQTPIWSGGNVNQSIDIPARSSRTFNLTNRLRSSGIGIHDNTVIITSDVDVSVFGYNFEDDAAEGFLVLPVGGLGSEYYAATYWPPITQTQFGILALEDNSIIDVIFVSSRGVEFTYEQNVYRSGDSLRLTLNQYQTFQIQAAADLTATRIRSNKKLAVFSGNIDAGVNIRDPSNHLVEQMPPVYTYGYTFVALYIPGKSRGSRLKFVGATNQTEVIVDGQYYRTITESDGFQELDIPTGRFVYIQADQPILVTQYFFSEVMSGGSGDPSMTLLPPLNQWDNEFRFVTHDLSDVNYLMVVLDGARTDLVNQFVCLFYKLFLNKITL